MVLGAEGNGEDGVASGDPEFKYSVTTVRWFFFEFRLILRSVHYKFVMLLYQVLVLVCRLCGCWWCCCIRCWCWCAGCAGVGDAVVSRPWSTSLDYQPLPAAACCSTFHMCQPSPLSTELIVAPHNWTCKQREYSPDNDKERPWP